MAGEELLLKPQKNALFEAIRERSFDPSDFVWNHLTGSNRRERIEIRLRGTDYYFQFPPELDACFMSPGAESLTYAKAVSSWPILLNLFYTWLVSLRREIETPDLWAGVRDRLDAAQIAASEDNTPFSAEEQIRIRASLRDVVTQLEAQHELTREQLAVVANRVEYLVEASKRMGRKDFMMIVIGTIAVAAFPPETVRRVWDLIWAAVSWAVTGHPQLPAG